MKIKEEPTTMSAEYVSLLDHFSEMTSMTLGLPACLSNRWLSSSLCCLATDKQLSDFCSLKWGETGFLTGQWWIVTHL